MGGDGLYLLYLFDYLFSICLLCFGIILLWSVRFHQNTGLCCKLEKLKKKMKLGAPYRTVWIQALVGVGGSEVSGCVELLLHVQSLPPVSIGMLGVTL